MPDALAQNAPLPATARPPRLAVLQLRGLEHFLPDMVAGLSASGQVTVRRFTVTGPEVLAAALAWTDDPARDALWFEFCWPPFPELIARTEFGGRRVIVRVHRIEAYETPHVARCPWHKVSDLITVSEDMRRIVLEQAPLLEQTTRVHVVHNGVDTARFMPPSSPPDRFRIGWCGNMIARKNATLALEIMVRLLASDSRWRLHIASGGGDRLIEEALVRLVGRMGLGGAVIYDGAIEAASMPHWHARNAILLSTSLHESFGYAIAEAAAAGCDLAVLDHRGAAEFWPAAVLFGAVEGAVNIIRAAQPGRWRSLIERRFGLERQVAHVLRLLAEPMPAKPDFSSAVYWEGRYAQGGNSGAGSYGRLARYKADIINTFVRDNSVASVLELGCGDGHQLGMLELPAYTGIDVAASALDRCRAVFVHQPTYGFALPEALTTLPRHDLALSLDVIFHLVEDRVYVDYLDQLFGAARRFVIIYSSDIDSTWSSPHVRHRRFSADVAARYPAWRRVSRLRHPFPYRPEAPDETSFAEFHIYAAPGEVCRLPEGQAFTQSEVTSA